MDRAPSPGTVTVDLHGKTAYQARVTVDAALRRADQSVYRLTLIHGFRQGTALRDMLAEEYAGHPRVKRLTRPEEGVTVLVLREL